MAGKRVENFIVSVIEKAIREIIPSSFSSDTPSICLEIPKDKLHGDLSCNIAMRLARFLSSPAEQLAEKIVEKIKGKLESQIDKIEVYPPGFINFFISYEPLYKTLLEIKREKSNYGRTNLGKGKKLQIEFVSANPTGPLSVAHGRQAAVGDSLANILEFSGYKVSREYYINDEGTQIDLLGRSIKSRVFELLGESTALPEGAYLGEYIFDIARTFLAKYKKKELNKLSLNFFSRFGCQYILRTIKKDLKEFGVKFDVFFSQASLRTRGEINRVLKFLEKRGFIYKKEGALWFRSTQFSDDKDRVVIRSNGDYTYLTPDIAYHRDKFERGFKKIINIWGPDHHGYVSRIKAAVSALGFEEDALSIIIVQLVTLLKGKEKIQMSTRRGKFLTLQEVIREVGKDATRFFFVMRRTNSHLDFDLELAKETSLNNPVYYIQYAHARIWSILEFKKKKKNFSPSVPLDPSSKRIRKVYPLGLELELLNKPEEIAILKLLRQFPQIVALGSQTLEPYRVVNYLQDLACAFHAFYTKHRVVTDNLPQTKVRILLVECVCIVLANGLRLLGISAPKKM